MINTKLLSASFIRIMAFLWNSWLRTWAAREWRQAWSSACVQRDAGSGKTSALLKVLRSFSPSGTCNLARATQSSTLRWSSRARMDVEDARPPLESGAGAAAAENRELREYQFKVIVIGDPTVGE